MGLNYVLRRTNEHKTTSWSGGLTTEIFIYPPDSLYSERNFDWRISSATVDQDESDFTKLDGYMRHIMVLAGKLKLIHESNPPINLSTYQQHYFDGNCSTKSFFKCIDLNLMLKKGYTGGLNCIKANDYTNINHLFTSFYPTQDKVTMKVFENSNIVLDEILNKGDFILFDYTDILNENQSILFENDKFLPTDTIAVEVFINKENLNG